jgi:serine/threonine protein kinase
VLTRKQVVSPYYKNGSLVKYLKDLDAGAPVDMLRLMSQVARGMAYLHKQGVLHGDLKAANVLVDDGLRCVISDFGQSEMKSEVVRLSGAVPSRGTLRWQAPEIMQGRGGLAPEADVYAFAILCVEIMDRGSLPWPLVDDESVRHFVSGAPASPSRARFSHLHFARSRGQAAALAEPARVWASAPRPASGVEPRAQGPAVVQDDRGRAQGSARRVGRCWKRVAAHAADLCHHRGGGAVLSARVAGHASQRAARCGLLSHMLALSDCGPQRHRTTWSYIRRRTIPAI